MSKEKKKDKSLKSELELSGLDPKEKKSPDLDCNKEPDELFAAALCKFQSEMPTVPRDKTASFKTKWGQCTYKYADLAKIWETMKPHLTKNGFSILQLIQHEEGTNYLYTKLIHIGGEIVESKARLDCIGSDIKGMGSAISYYRRYTICAMLGIVSDDDANENLENGDFEKALDKDQLNHINQHLTDFDGLRTTLCSLYGDINKIPQTEYDDVVRTILDHKANVDKKEAEEKVVSFLKKYGMDKEKTKYHTYIDWLISKNPNTNFDAILEQAALNEDKFIEGFNGWENSKPSDDKFIKDFEKWDKK